VSAAPVAAKKSSGADEAKAVGTKWWTPYALLTPGMLWLVVFFAIPTITLVGTSLQSGSLEQGFTFTFAFSNYVDAITGSWEVYLKSLAYSLSATALCLAIAYPLAYTMAFKAGRLKNIMLVLVIAPFFTSFLLRTNAWKTILSDTGFVVQLMDKLHLLDLLHAIQIPVIFADGITGADRVLQTPLAVILGLTYNFLPFMTLPIYVSLEKIDKRLVEAAEDLFATRIGAFRRITFPLSLPGVFAGSLLTFIPAMGDYINAELLGNPQTTMIGNVIQNQFLTQNNFPTASALSFILMAGILIAVAIYARLLGTDELAGGSI
jgi:spermidine/putrescine transport system permease protein